MRTFSTLALATAIVALSALHLHGADWPQWRGPDRTGISRETGLLKTWPKGGPKLLWTFEKAGNGYATFAVVDGVLYTMGARGDDEFVFALDAKGNEKWATKIGPVYDYKANAWSRGPNSCPSVDGDLVFALGSQGHLVCVKKGSGELVWKKDLPKEMAAEVNPVGGGPDKMGWGYCWSPLVDGDKLIITPGGPKGLFAALDKKTGSELWRSKGVPDQATYSSPIKATLGGVDQYVTLVQNGSVGVSAANGELLWRFKRDDDYPDVVCPTPIWKGDIIYTPVGNGGGCDALQVTSADKKKFTVKPAWTEQQIGSRNGGVVLLDGYTYGFHENVTWMCQDFKTGAINEKWKAPRKAALKPGGAIAAAGLLFTVDETGIVAALEANPAAYKEVGRFKLPQESKIRKPSGKVWTHPVVADGKLYVRDQEYIFCYQVKSPG
jgi:outer membrane protein assembly factor BamB